MLRFILCYIFFLFFGYFSVFSQDTILEYPINLKLKNCQINDVFDEISKKTKYFFTYDASIISQKKELNIDVKNTIIKDILFDIFKDKSLEYKVIEDHIVIFKSEKKDMPTIEKDNEDLPKNIIIKGKITDAETNNEIPFVSIGISGQNVGTVTNGNGEFQLKISEELSESEIIISHIGYRKFVKPVKYFIDKENIISLQKVFISLQEVIIRNNDPMLLIESALQNKNKNYSTKPYILTTYYREGVKRNNISVTFSEAVLGIYKTPYKKGFSKDKVKIIKSRKLINIKEADTIFMKLKGGLNSALALDFMKNPIDFLINENMKYYDYQTVDIVSFNDKPAHVIEFKQKEFVLESLYKGKIYIETETFAVVGAEFEMSFITNADRKRFIVKKHRNIKSKAISAKYKISYKKINGKYIINHVRTDLKFKVRRRKSFSSSTYHTFFELIICDADSTNVKKFSKKETIKTNKVFIDNNFDYDKNFWGNFNFILPEKPISETLIYIKMNIKEWK